jgi:hypothetical protein
MYVSLIVLFIAFVLWLLIPRTSKSAEAAWESAMRRIRRPPVERTVWSRNPTRLSAVLVEFREHPWMQSVLYNMAHVYGGTDAGLVIVHGRENKTFVENIVRDWTHVRLVCLDYENIDIATYNRILTDKSFWDNFDSEYVLIFQTDSLMRTRIPESFFEYDYVGAPWAEDLIVNGKRLSVGNGGLSLRRVRTMKQICVEHPYKDFYHPNEDIFFSYHCQNVPSREVAAALSVETVFYDRPCGMHKPYGHLTSDQVETLLKDIPGT